MRIAVISDIHANLHALEAVLAAIDDESIDEVWCLGDLVGYGPRPNECVTLVRERTAVCLAGNHDLAVLGSIDLDLFVGAAGAAARWTRTVLDPAARTFLETLEPTGARIGAALAHGSPRDPIWEYVLSPHAAEAAFATTEEPLVLVGHSHVQLALALEDGKAVGGAAAADEVVDLTPGRRLLNPGSVGQPRDGDPRAAWLVVDVASSRATFRRTTYSIERTQAEMRERDLPKILSERLAHGA
jgi:predicted phosphodiesterase